MNVVGGSGFTGAIGIVAIPEDDAIDEPMSLIAVTLAKIVDESPRLNGLALRTETGTLQVLELMIVESLSALQLAKSVSKVPDDAFISSLYPPIARPPRSEGKLQLMTISVSSPLTAKDGLLGLEGMVAAMIVNTEE